MCRSLMPTGCYASRRVEWRWLRAALQASKVRALRATNATDPEQHSARLAQALLRLAATHAVLGQHSAAADSTQEAVDLYRELTALNRDATCPTSPLWSTTSPTAWPSPGAAPKGWSPPRKPSTFAGSLSRSTATPTCPTSPCRSTTSPTAWPSPGRPRRSPGRRPRLCTGPSDPRAVYDDDVSRAQRLVTDLSTTVPESNAPRGRPPVDRDEQARPSDP